MSDSRGRYSVVRSDSTPAKAADDAADSREFQHAVRIQHGRWRIAIPWAVIAAAASSVGTFYATHSTPVDCAARGDLNALEKRIADQMGAQAGDIKKLTETVNRNADQAHNDIVSAVLALTRQAPR